MPMSAPIVMMTVAIATSIGAVISAKLRKKIHINRKIATAAMGAEIAI